MTEPILTTKECEKCGYLFSRYMDHMPDAQGREPKREQRMCPQCDLPRFVVKVRHPGEKL